MDIIDADLVLVELEDYDRDADATLVRLAPYSTEEVINTLVLPEIVGSAGIIVLPYLYHTDVIAVLQGRRSHVDVTATAEDHSDALIEIEGRRGYVDIINDVTLADPTGIYTGFKGHRGRFSVDSFQIYDTDLEVAIQGRRANLLLEGHVKPDQTVVFALQGRRSALDVVTNNSKTLFVTDTLGFGTPTTSIERILALIETLALEDLFSTYSYFTLEFADEIGFGERVRAVFEILVQDVLNLSSTETITRAGVLHLLDRLLLSDSILTQKAAMVSLASALLLSERMDFGKRIDWTDGFALDDDFTVRLAAYLSVIESIALSDTASPTLTVLLNIADDVAFSETISTLADLMVLVQEGIGLSVCLRFGDEVYVGYALNTETGAVSRYEGMNFNSMCRLATGFIGAGDAGIYQLAGDTDEGEEIPWSIKTGLLDLGAPSTVPVCYLITTTQGETLLKVRVQERNGEKTEFWYRPVQYELGSRAQIGKGIRGRFWQFELVGTGPLELEAVSIVPIAIGRRI